MIARVLLGLALLLAACGKDPVTEAGGPEIAAVRLEAGTQVIRIGADGSVTGGSIRLGPLASVLLEATVLRADGTPEPAVQESPGYRLDVVTGHPGMTFTRTGRFSGTLTASNERGPSGLNVSLYNSARGRIELSSAAVGVIVE